MVVSYSAGMVIRRLNRALRSATGYQLQRADSSEGGQRAPVRGRKAPRRTAAAGGGPRPGGGRPRNPNAEERGLPAHYDDQAKAIIRHVRPRTMTNAAKLFGLILATRYIANAKIPGEIVECGVWRGGSMQAVALTLLEMGDTSRCLHLFDTYEGMTPPSDKDRRHDGKQASDMLASRSRDSHVWAVATLDDVQAGMAEIEYPADRVRFHKGPVEETIPTEAPEHIAMLRLDTDWYESTRHELQHLYDRLAPGGVLIIDDYGYWEGSRLATEEFLRSAGVNLLLIPMGTGRIAVKPSD
jgi:O-methyltransferase